MGIGCREARLHGTWYRCPYTLIVGPDSVTMFTPACLDTGVTITTAGSYVLRLTVSDWQFTTSDDVTVSVAAAPTPSTSTQMPPITSGGDNGAADGPGVVLSGMAMALHLRRRVLTAGRTRWMVMRAVDG